MAWGRRWIVGVAAGMLLALQGPACAETETGTGTLTGQEAISNAAESASVGAAVSLFVGTDRHAEMQTIPAETQTASRPGKNGGSRAGETASRGGNQAGGKKTAGRSSGGKSTVVIPVLNREGSPVWEDSLDEVLSLVASDPEAVQPEAVFLGGDYVGQDGTDPEGNSLKTPVFSVTEMKEEILAALGTDTKSWYTYGSHDLNESGAYTDSFLTGPVEMNGYYLYGISYGQMIYATDAQAAEYRGKDAADPRGASAESAAASFLSWAETLEDHLPILVMTHVPLHAHRGDNLGAEIWTKALNQATEDHDILVMWGHNHTVEERDKTGMEQRAYLVMPGSELTVQTAVRSAGSRKKSGNRQAAEETDDTSAAVEIAFAYMNAGYLNQGIGTLLTFREENGVPGWDTLTAVRYHLGEEKETLWAWNLNEWKDEAQSGD